MLKLLSDKEKWHAAHDVGEHERQAQLRALDHRIELLKRERQLQTLQGEISAAADLGRRQVDAQIAEQEATVAKHLGGAARPTQATAGSPQHDERRNAPGPLQGHLQNGETDLEMRRYVREALGDLLLRTEGELGPNELEQIDMLKEKLRVAEQERRVEPAAAALFRGAK